MQIVKIFYFFSTLNDSFEWKIWRQILMHIQWYESRLMFLSAIFSFFSWNPLTTSVFTNKLKKLLNMKIYFSKQFFIRKKYKLKREANIETFDFREIKTVINIRQWKKESVKWIALEKQTKNETTNIRLLIEWYWMNNRIMFRKKLFFTQKFIDRTQKMALKDWFFYLSTYKNGRRGRRANRFGLCFNRLSRIVSCGRR